MDSEDNLFRSSVIFTMTCGHACLDWFPVEQGLRQGCVLAAVGNDIMNRDKGIETAGYPSSATPLWGCVISWRCRSCLPIAWATTRSSPPTTEGSKCRTEVLPPWSLPLGPKRYVRGIWLNCLGNQDWDNARCHRRHIQCWDSLRRGRPAHIQRLVQLPKELPRTIRPTGNSPRFKDPGAEKKAKVLTLILLYGCVPCSSRSCHYDALQWTHDSLLTRFIRWQGHSRTDKADFLPWHPPEDHRGDIA